MRTAVVHDLIKYLIDETKLFLDIVLGDLPITICLADEDKLVEELHCHGCIEVGLGGGQKVNKPPPRQTPHTTPCAMVVATANITRE